MANHRTDIKLGDLLVKMRSAGCYALFFGVESASAEVQASINKGLDIGGVVETAKSLSNIGMSATSSFILGFPDETPEQMSATIALGAELKLLGTDIVQFHRLRLWPPAAIAQSDLPNQFDRSSLEIEYPIQPPPEEDVQKIQMDPLFFSGYFVPNSKAGSPEQLAQAECSSSMPWLSLRLQQRAWQQPWVLI